MRNIKLVIPFYNAEKYITKCLESVFNQTYKKYKLIVINDCSSDDSHNKVLPFLDLYPDKMIYLKNEKRMFTMYNHQNAVFNYCDSEDIIVHLDGDDYLIDDNVLDYINTFYESTQCLMMYGQATYLDGRKGNAKPYKTKYEFEMKRSLPFYVSHIRTFIAKLFFEIKNQDPLLFCFKDHNGEWYKMSADVAIMYPIMEIAGYENVKYNEKSLYIYNNLNPICDYKINVNLQESIHHEILSKPSFKRVF